MSEVVRISGFQGQAVAVKGNDVDTDRIIPARFMKCVTFAGLGKYAFYDERMESDGSSKGHAFDDSRWERHPVLVANANFGCGSSREHAPQALKDYGIRAIIAESFAEIFAGNCSSLGIPAITMVHDAVTELQVIVDTNPDIEVSIDLNNMVVTAGAESWKAMMPEAYRQALLDGSWDSTSVLAQSMDLVEEVAKSLPYVS